MNGPRPVEPMPGPAIPAGTNVKAVQRMLGHASAAMTLDVYADLFEDDLEQVADRLDRAARQGTDQHCSGHCRGPVQKKNPRPVAWGFSWSRLTESNRRPTHYECVALAD